MNADPLCLVSVESARPRRGPAMVSSSVVTLQRTGAREGLARPHQTPITVRLASVSKQVGQGLGRLLQDPVG